MNYDALTGMKQAKVGKQNMDLYDEASGSKCFIGNRSFKVVTSKNANTSKANNIRDLVDLTPKKKIKTKMSRLSLKRMLNSDRNAGQSQLNTFPCLKTSKGATAKVVVDKVKKIKKSSKNLTEDKEKLSSGPDKVIYKISTAIFGPANTRNCNKPEANSEKLTKKVSKMKTVSKELIGVNDGKFELTAKFETLDPKSSKFSVNLTTENNLKLELISNKSNNRRCRSLESKKSPITPKKVRFSNEIKSFSLEKRFKRTPSYKSLDDVSIQTENESPKGNKNVFEFMMDTRNKIIGRNSPGKDKKLQENVEEMSDLVQRKSILQQWSDKKGSAGKRKIDDSDRRGEYIEFALKKRAKRLKKLLNCEDVNDIVCKDNKMYDKKVKISKYVQEMAKCNIEDDDILIDENDSSSVVGKSAKSSLKLPKKPLQQTLLYCISNMDNLNTSKMDNSLNKVTEIEEFSPKKIRKKKKVTLENKKNDDDDDDAIRSRLTEKYLGNKLFKEKKSKKLLKNRIIDDIDESSRDSISSKTSLTSDKSTIKGTKSASSAQSFNEDKEVEIKSLSVMDLTDSTKDVDGNLRRRRSVRVRKPVEYFHPGIPEDVPEKEVKTNKIKLSKGAAAKVPSVFLKAVPKPKVDPAILEARRSFLHSASPIKRKESTVVIENSEFEPFPTFSHTQQKTDSILWNLPAPIRPQKMLLTPPLLSLPLIYKRPQMSSSIAQNVSANAKTIKLRKLSAVHNKKRILRDIKAKHPDYPVYRIYKHLRLKNKHAKVMSKSVDLSRTVPRKLLDDSCLPIDSDNDSSFQSKHFDCATLWTDKYKPTCSVDIIGNRPAAVDFLKFLKQRLLYCNEAPKRKRTKNRPSDSEDDFVSSDDDDNNSNSRDVRLSGGNTMLLRGPHGSGKTSSIYAVCQELDINVLELNASSKRTGRILIQKLQEATQSQQIHKQKDSQEIGSQNSDSKSLSKMCLLLVEDIDVVFEQDEGFISALTQLLQTTKRPIILTFTDETNANVQKFVQQYPVITFSQLSAETCSVWLQLVCLLENLLIGEDSLGELLEWNKGDLRATLLQLQFWGLTGGDALAKEVDSDESRVKISKRLSVYDTMYLTSESDTSENDGSDLEVAEESQNENLISSFLVGGNSVRSCSLGQVWWNFGTVLNRFHSGDPTEKTVLLTDNAPKATEPMKINLGSVSAFYDSLSLSDCLYNKFGLDPLDLEPTFKTFETKLKNSLALDHFEDCFTSEKDDVLGMTDFLVERSLARIVDGKMDGSRFRMSLPDATDRRWRFKQHRCQETFSENLPLNLSLDRRSFAVDYFPMLISIVKMEQARMKNGAKRRNRFYSYLRYLGFKFTDSQIKSLNNAFGRYETE